MSARPETINAVTLRALYIRQGIIRPRQEFDPGDPTPQPPSEGRAVFAIDDVGRREHERIVGTAHRDWRHPLEPQR